MAKDTRNLHMKQITQDIKTQALSLGFQTVGIAKPNLELHGLYLRRWLLNNYHGDMHYMARHGDKRFRPDKLVPGTLRVISVSMDYYPFAESPKARLQANEHSPQKPVIASYAHGKDYHKLIRKRLKTLATYLQTQIGPSGYRCFADSAPVLERAIANQAGLGWIGKNTLLINKNAGSLSFLGEIYTDIPLEVDTPASAHCGSCSRCIDVCPTQAIVAPYQLDARRCIAYLTIEYKGIIPEELRPLIGNRVFGCDDCQLVCPWNKFAKRATEPKFQAIHAWESADLVDLLLLTEAEFLQMTEGSVLRRPGHEGWQRNIAVSLGNTKLKSDELERIRAHMEHCSDLVKIHLDWALKNQMHLID